MGLLNKDVVLVPSENLDGKHTTVFINTSRTIFVDVDRTLVFFEGDPAAPVGPKITFNLFGSTATIIPHNIHVRMLKEFKARGHGVVVWSHGGALWAKSIVEALDLFPHVDMIVGKPDWILDDQSAVQWLGQRFYSDPKTGKIQNFSREEQVCKECGIELFAKTLKSKVKLGYGGPKRRFNARTKR